MDYNKLTKQELIANIQKLKNELDKYRGFLWYLYENLQTVTDGWLSVDVALAEDEMLYERLLKIFKEKILPKYNIVATDEEIEKAILKVLDVKKYGSGNKKYYALGEIDLEDIDNKYIGNVISAHDFFFEKNLFAKEPEIEDEVKDFIEDVIYELRRIKNEKIS